MLLLTKTEIIPPQAMAHSTSSDFRLTHFQECYPNVCRIAIKQRVQLSSVSSTITSRNNVIYDECSRTLHICNHSEMEPGCMIFNECSISDTCVSYAFNLCCLVQYFACLNNPFFLHFLPFIFLQHGLIPECQNLYAACENVLLLWQFAIPINRNSSKKLRLKNFKGRLNYASVFDSGSSNHFSKRTPSSGYHRNFIGCSVDKFHWLRCPE
ncbi:hypothetical protein Tsp_08505 [Trichinella spiralis]|uniref:hypothetical protein n=1 Tax=Trichinella spiralis TaxID=6334 RepID=UPI0001EFB96F|nr:hypothetical protein Tsp_08505 [Trichinella spiralis]